jgi:hypothetical protein
MSTPTTVRIRVYVDGAASHDSTLEEFLQDNAESPEVVAMTSALEVAAAGARFAFGGGAAPFFEVEVLGFDCTECGQLGPSLHCLDCSPVGKCPECGEVKQIDDDGTCSARCYRSKVNAEMWAEEEGGEEQDGRQLQ